MKIEKYEIEMLDVKAADAFIIHIVDEYENDHIILVDAGNYYDGQKIINHIKKYYANPKIDLAILTHPDVDHYGGFFYLLKKLESNEKDKILIEKFWIHDPSKHVTSKNVKYAWKEANAKAEAKSVLEFNGINLLDLIDKRNITRIEPFADTTRNTLKEQTDYKFYILGPTESFYDSKVLDFRHGLKPNYESEEGDTSITLNEGKVFSKTLYDAGDDSSAHNQCSLIFAFMPSSDKKYLFMGDAGELAFNNIPAEFRDYAKGVKWLKVPHHGSKYNMTNAMINTIKPSIAYISTEKIGNYLSRSLVNALKKSGSKVYSTHKNGSMLHNKIVDRVGYSTAESL